MKILMLPCVKAWNSFVGKKGNIKSLALRDWAGY
jgi:hypothetical protein